MSSKGTKQSICTPSPRYSSSALRLLSTSIWPSHRAQRPETARHWITFIPFFGNKSLERRWGSRTVHEAMSATSRLIWPHSHCQSQSRVSGRQLTRDWLHLDAGLNWCHQPEMRYFHLNIIWGRETTLLTRTNRVTSFGGFGLKWSSMTQRKEI